MAILLALVAAAAFGLFAVLVRIGMRRRADDDGLFMSVLVNVVALGPALLFVPLPQWDWSGIGGFMVAGLLGTWWGRAANLKAIRRIGAARGNALMVSSPVFAAVGGFLLLGERISPVRGLGAALVLLGTAVVVRSRVAAESLTEAPGRPANGVAGQRPARGRGDRDRGAGIGYAVAAAAFFGFGFVARKWGITRYPSPVAGAFFGAVVSLTLLTVRAAVTGTVRRVLDRNLREVPWWFVAAGIATSVALLAQFAALTRLPTWMASVLQGTQGLWALVWSYLFIRREERLRWTLVGASVLIAAGVGVMARGA